MFRKNKISEPVKNTQQDEYKKTLKIRDNLKKLDIIESIFEKYNNISIKPSTQIIRTIISDKESFEIEIERKLIHSIDLSKTININDVYIDVDGNLQNWYCNYEGYFTKEKLLDWSIDDLKVLDKSMENVKCL